MGSLPGMSGWDWKEEIRDHIRERQREKNKELVKRRIAIYKNGKVYVEAVYFEELAKQMKHRVSIAVSSFPKEDDRYVVSEVGYNRLCQYLPLPTLESIQQDKG